MRDAPREDVADSLDDRPYLIPQREQAPTQKKIWKDAFDGTVKKLLIDFELSKHAECRSHHLDRLHSWFVEQGSKKARSKKAAPNFLMLEPPRGGWAGSWPKGSPRNIDAPLSEPCVLLSGTVTMKKSPQLIAAGSRPLSTR